MTTIADKIRAAIAAESPDTQGFHADFIAAVVCKVLANQGEAVMISTGLGMSEIDEVVRTSVLLATAAELTD